jgi:hypothetical protein
MKHPIAQKRGYSRDKTSMRQADRESLEPQGKRRSLPAAAKLSKEGSEGVCCPLALAEVAGKDRRRDDNIVVGDHPTTMVATQNDVLEPAFLEAGDLDGDVPDVYVALLKMERCQGLSRPEALQRKLLEWQHEASASGEDKRHQGTEAGGPLE